MERVPGQEAQPLFTPSELGHSALLDLRTLAQRAPSAEECPLEVIALSSAACSQARIGMFLEQICLELHDLVRELKRMNGDQP